MRILLIMFAAPSLLSACAATVGQTVHDPWSAAPPSERLVDHIERLLAEDACIGKMGRWARFYEWSQTKDGIDTSTVEIDLREAGVFEFTPGRRIRSRDPSLAPGEILISADDRHYRVAFGSYDVEKGKLEVHACGQNSN